ncbi:MAG: tetratricopeptide repeat protein [Gammaproteobacteria bacterium]
MNPYSIASFHGSTSGLRVMVLLAALSLVSGCTGIKVDSGFSPDPETTARVIAQDKDRFPAVDPLYLDDNLKLFLERQVGFGGTVRERVEKLQNLLFSAEFLDLQYSDERTQTAVEVFDSGEGNCLSVTNLYVAAARYLGIDASFQVVKVRPSWDRKGSLVVVSEHINAVGKLTPFETYVVDFTPDLALQQLTARAVSDQHARAMYFNNLAVEQLVIRNYQAALDYLRNALWIMPDLAIAWNNIGTTFNRLGDAELAEYGYQMAFHYQPDNAAAVGNLARLYEAQGARSKAAALRRAVVRVNRANPYYHFEQGNFAFQDGRFDEAISFYQRAIRLNEYDPVFYVALANVYDVRGDEQLQRRMMRTAAEILVDSQFIYVPSDQKLRILDSKTILNDASAGLTIAIE